MKKTLILSFLLLFAITGLNAAEAYKAKSSDYQIVTTPVKEEAIEVKKEIFKEFPSGIQIVKLNDKYAIYNSKEKKYIMNGIIDSITEIGNSDNEFKIKISDNTGYFNADTKQFIMPYCDDFTLLNKYIKTKKDGKFGLVDKNGDEILHPVFQSISIINTNNEEYIITKQNGKTKVYKTTGEYIPDNELYTISNNEYYTLVNDLRPVFRASYKDSKTTLYEKAEYTGTYEIQELALPKKVKVQNISKVLPKAEVIQNKENIVIDKKEYVLVHNNNRSGISTIGGKEIVPAVYTNIELKQPCEHFRHKVAVASYNNNVTIYDLKGNVLAQGDKNNVNVNYYGKTYIYTKDDAANIWNLTLNGKKIGNIAIVKDKYEFTKTAFHLLSLHKINELMLTAISAK